MLYPVVNRTRDYNGCRNESTFLPLLYDLHKREQANGRPVKRFIVYKNLNVHYHVHKISPLDLPELKGNPVESVYYTSARFVSFSVLPVCSITIITEKNFQKTDIRQFYYNLLNTMKFELKLWNKGAGKAQSVQRLVTIRTTEG
jgi:hypothetical protein